MEKRYDYNLKIFRMKVINFIISEKTFVQLKNMIKNKLYFLYFNNTTFLKCTMLFRW